MLYIHYCESCDKVHILNGHKKKCPKCEGALKELPISFLQYTSQNRQERDDLLARFTAGEDISILPHKENPTENRNFRPDDEIV